MTARDLSAARSVEHQNEIEAEPAAAGPEVAWAPADGGEIEIRLADLIGDERGEIFLCNDSSARSLNILADASVVASGRAELHVTAGGADVSGFRFIRFDNGLTIYFEESLGLFVRGADRTDSF